MTEVYIYSEPLVGERLAFTHSSHTVGEQIRKTREAERYLNQWQEDWSRIAAQKKG